MSRPKYQPNPGLAESPDEYYPATSPTSPLGCAFAFSCSIDISAHAKSSFNAASGVRIAVNSSAMCEYRAVCAAYVFCSVALNRSSFACKAIFVAVSSVLPAAILNLALAYTQLHDYAKSVKMFRLFSDAKNHAQQTLTPEAAIAYAGALAATADFIDAQKQLELALTISPDNALLHDALGSLLAQHKQYDEATAQFQRAIALDPALASAHYRIRPTRPFSFLKPSGFEGWGRVPHI